MPRLYDMARNSLNQFLPKTQSAIQLAEAALAAGEAKLIELDRTADDDAAKYPDDDARLDRNEAAISVQRRRIKGLHVAVAAAKQAEQQRLIDLAVRANQAKVNALKQHLLAREKTAVHLQAAIKNVADIWLEFEAYGDKIRPLVPPMDWIG